VTVHHDTFLIIKPNRCTNFSNWNKTLHVSDSSSVQHQEFVTVHTAMVYVSKPVWHTLLLFVQWKTPDNGQRNCPKHLEFHSKNKFEKLVHLVGFIIRSFKYYYNFNSWREISQWHNSFTITYYINIPCLYLKSYIVVNYVDVALLWTMWMWIANYVDVDCELCGCGLWTMWMWIVNYVDVDCELCGCGFLWVNFLFQT
jgi:hypothetical protein